MTAPLYIALMHYPVFNKQGAVVTTSLTNFDLHDLSRTASTFGVQKCFIVTPNPAQQNMAHYIKAHWIEGFGATYNPDRKEAFQVLEVTSDLDETYLTIQNLHGTPPQLIGTTARSTPKALTFKDLRKKMTESEQPVLLLFGTGWGMTPELMNRTDAVLEPIKGPTEYNHLPVRAAVAIILDRLLAPQTH